MRVAIFALAVWALAVTASHAQPGPALQGARAAAEAIAGGERGPVDPQASWRDAKKLTVMEAVPGTPHDQAHCLVPSALREGTVGYLDGWPTEVVQIAGPNDMLLLLGGPNLPPIWLTGYPTKGLANGEKVRLIGPVEIGEAKPLSTGSGAQTTVRVVRLVTRERLASIEAEAEAKRSAAQFRKWTDATGRFSVEAKFLEFKGGQVSLQRKGDGKVLELPMSRLDKIDQKWIRDELKRRVEEERKNGAAKSPPTNRTQGR